MNKAILITCVLLCCTALAGPAAAQQESVYGPVQKNETLFQIARRHRHRGATMAQTMMAIFRSNPEAFEQGNINRLRVGARLRIPGAEETARIARGEAYREAARQIDVYESEVRELKVQRGELAPLARDPRDPDLDTGLAVESAIAAPDSGEIEEIRQQLAAEQQAGQALPEPKPPQRQLRTKSSAPLFRYSYDISIVDDDNVRLAQDDDDIRGDLIFSPTIKARAGKSLDSFTIWNYGGSATYNLHETFDELDNLEFEINTRYRFALASGFTAPIYAFGARIGGAEYESEMRDATRLSLSAEINKWLTTTVNMTAGLGFNTQESKSEVYDTSETRLFVNFDTELSKTDLVYTTFTYITGDIVSSATPTLGIINAADAIEPDDAFGGVELNQFAYRIDADTIVVTLGYNRIMTGSLSLDFSARFVDSEAKDDDSIGYERTILRASLLGRF